MRPSDSKKIFNVTLRRKSFPTTGLDGGRRWRIGCRSEMGNSRRKQFRPHRQHCAQFWMRPIARVAAWSHQYQHKVSFTCHRLGRCFRFLYIYDTIRYDTIRDAILTCARKPTWVSWIYRTEPTTKKCKTEKKLKIKSGYAQKQQ